MYKICFGKTQNILITIFTLSIRTDCKKVYKKSKKNHSLACNYQKIHLILPPISKVMYQINNKGYYGKYGGAYIPEILHRCVTELRETYCAVLESESFEQEFHRLLCDYAGRPSALYLAGRLSEKYGCRI